MSPERPPSTFGDPDGPHWSAGRPETDVTDAHREKEWRRQSRGRSAQNPYQIRMFAEIGCDFALWGEIDEVPPTSDGMSPDRLEDELPITPELRAGLLTWANDYVRYDGGDRTIDMTQFDRRGFLLSRELQRQLGEVYTVRFHVEFADTDKEALRAEAAVDPVHGWRLH